MLNRDPDDWDDEIVTMAKMNREIRDAIRGIQAEWELYVSTWSTSSGSIEVGNGQFTAKYHRIGKTVWFRIEILMGSTTTYGTGQYSLSLPVPAEGQGRQPFVGVIRDVSAGENYPIFGLLDPAGAVIALRQLPTTAGGPFANVGQGSPVTLGTGDLIVIHGTYEAA